MNEFELKGIWWLPENPEDELTGTLNFSPSNGAYLELLGTFGEKLSNPDRSPTLIQGISKTGKQITLSKCIPVNRLINFPGIGEEKYFAHHVFIGAHFDSEEDIRFNHLLLRTTDLDAWANTFGFKINQDFEPSGEYGAIIEYRQPASKLVAIDVDTSVGVTFSSYGPMQEIVQTKADITQKAYLSVIL